MKSASVWAWKWNTKKPNGMRFLQVWTATALTWLPTKWAWTTSAKPNTNSHNLTLTHVQWSWPVLTMRLSPSLKTSKARKPLNLWPVTTAKWRKNTAQTSQALKAWPKRLSCWNKNALIWLWTTNWRFWISWKPKAMQAWRLPCAVTM